MQLINIIIFATPHSHSIVTQLTAPVFMRAVAAQKDVCNFCVTKVRKLLDSKALQPLDFQGFYSNLVTRCAAFLKQFLGKEPRGLSG